MSVEFIDKNEPKPKKGPSLISILIASFFILVLYVIGTSSVCTPRRSRGFFSEAKIQLASLHNLELEAKKLTEHILLV